MKKTFLVFGVLVCAHVLNGAEKASNAISRLSTTVSDKWWNPEGILEELKKNGVSKDLREEMTQMHRLDRYISILIENKNHVKLCDDLTTIVTKNFPLSHIGYKMAKDYLWQERPAKKQEKPILDRMNETLDLLNPAQIIDDLEKGQIYSEEKVDLETRINKILEKLVKLEDTNNLRKLVKIIEQRSKSETTKIIPGARICQLAYKFLREQEKETVLNKKALSKTFNAKKTDSDTE